MLSSTWSHNDEFLGMTRDHEHWYDVQAITRPQLDSRAGLSDQALVAQVLAGEQAAFATLYTRHASLVARRLRRVVVRSVDVEDLVQKTFLVAYGSLAKYRPECSFPAWLSGIAIRCALNFLRSTRRRFWQRPMPLGDVELAPAVTGTTAEQIAIERQLLRRIYSAMERLPAKKRIAFALCDLEGLELKEVAELLGSSTSTIGARVQSARQLIRKVLQRDAARAASARRRAAEEP